MRRPRSLAVFTVVVAVMVFGAIAPAAANDINQRVPLPVGAVTNPCPPPNAITFAGSAHVVGHITQSGSGLHFIGHVNLQATGAGFPSGTPTYTTGGVVNVEAKALTFPLNFNARYRLISGGSASNLFLTIRFQIQSNKLVTIQQLEINCRG